ncbi:hypothetical protein V6x_63000 [Gimesia chilikensis]|uniref:ATPase AAA-type core domain-containing protein n=1 Tax=Gimesia chilikensis TaxID=2605989 RepID=A0A517WMQ2_9PLAN|nr:ATP-binding protein [Gimesia chilikensis]QDU06546.1 hypothetical protein V6x_63000 [Gimesia chilikensis]
MITDSFKFKGYECFKNEYSGLDEFKPITVIIGRNNTGKSHLLDVLSLLTSGTLENIELDYCASGVLDEASLRRTFPENSSGGGLSGSNHWHYQGQRYVNEQIEWNYNSVDKIASILNVSSHDTRWANEENARRKRLSRLVSNAATPLSKRIFLRLLADRDMQPEHENSALNLEPDGAGATNIIRKYILSSKPEMREELIQDDLLNALSNIFGDDGEFTKIDVRHHEDDNRWEVFLGEPNKGLIPLSRSGSGLKTVILVLLHLLVLPHLKSKENHQFVFAFEELENNLHPALLRRLFQFIADYVERENCTLFLTTHSNVALDFFGLRQDTQIIHVNHDGNTASTRTVTAHFDHVGLLTELGSRPSDLLQANGVLWLEGPSDRIYLNHFINLYSDGNLREGRDYQCAFYGGSILANSTFTSPDETDETFANLLRLNHNIAVICDGDRTAASGKGSRIKGRVQRIKQEVEMLRSAFLWITNAKEIENYIPGSVWSTVYDVDNVPDPNQYDTFPSNSSKNSDFVQRHLKRKTFDKCDFAMKSVQHIELSAIERRFELNEKMLELISTIKKWNES